jgi:hypothetical protein
MGLYGQAQGMSGSGSGEFGEPHEGLNGRGDEHGSSSNGGANPDTPTADEANVNGAAAGASEVGIPLRYRGAVRQYFRRLNEELGDRDSQRGAARP